MSVSSLPEWKQLLLDKKRREEEERERREKEEEQKLASMPAWKRGIIQRRKAKQEVMGDKDREKDRDVCFVPVDFRSSSDGLSDTDSSVTLTVGSDPSLSPDPGHWLDADTKSLCQVSAETIVPIHENPFIRTQSVRRKSRDAEARGNDPDVKEKQKDGHSPRGRDGEPRRGRDIELKIERFRDVSEGRDTEKNRDRSQGRDKTEGWEKEVHEEQNDSRKKEKSQWKESVQDEKKRKEFQKVKKDEEKDTEPSIPAFAPPITCLHTIRANNIIIIGKDRTGSDERRSGWRETEREKPKEDQHGKTGTRMDLREILAGGGSVTEIRASEVLLIKPPAGSEEKNTVIREKAWGREEGECPVDEKRDRESSKEQERPRGQATVIKEAKRERGDDNVFVEKGGRVSQLLSKFGQRRNPPSRSTSSDNFLRPARRKSSENDEDDDEHHQVWMADWRYTAVENVPKRSFSFSDRVICAKENGLDEGYHERKMHDRIHSDKYVAPGLHGTGLWKKETAAKNKLECQRHLTKHGDGISKNDHHTEINKAETLIPIQQKTEVMTCVNAGDRSASEKTDSADGEKGFTVAMVKNREGISFARRVAIRQDGKARASERQVKSAEKEQIVETKTEQEGITEPLVGDIWREEELDRRIPGLVMEASGVCTIPTTSGNDLYSHESSDLLCEVADCAGDSHRQSIPTLSSKQKEDLCKSEQTEETAICGSDEGETSYGAARETTKDSRQEVEIYGENIIHDVTPKLSKRIITPVGIPPGPCGIQIPRTVFYVAEEMMERKTVSSQSEEVQDWKGGRGNEKRDSWRIGKPLSRIESLREKIRQRELERLREKEVQDGDRIEAVEGGDALAALERGSEIEDEWEAATHVCKRVLEPEKGQEGLAAQTSTTASDITRDSSVLKTCPQLPVFAASGEEATSGYATAVLEAIAGSFHVSDDEDDPLKREEEQLSDHTDWQRDRDTTKDEREEEEEELSEKEDGEYTSLLVPSPSLSPCLPQTSSLPAMSRIYNLEAVGSRTGLGLRQRTGEIPSVHLVKVKPIVSNGRLEPRLNETCEAKQLQAVAKHRENKVLSSEDMCGVQSIQRQMEQFQMKEQEAVKSTHFPCTLPDTHLRDQESKGQQSPRGVLMQQVKDSEVKTQQKDQRTSEVSSRISPTSQLTQVPSKQTTSITSASLRSQSPDNSLKLSDYAPTPASSPSSLSPAQSPRESPSSNPSPTHFCIRSASGGKAKRGATITITPKKTARGGVKAVTPTGSTTTKTPALQAQSASAEPPKKKYPTVEEIEVIGGYQNLEKSCLVKNKGSPKKAAKVYFDEDQLEQVCEYPSESSMLACTPYPHDLGNDGKPQAEEPTEEQMEEERVMTKTTKNVWMSTARVLRADEACP
ncbi:uncharacterized protein ppp1r18 [Thalassophryne amazonica]|uniref:uncharacterized protein ppp1r18 n=1 Tax=Thalassophryne amazonica TaxID=390379 RepID=UPI001470AA08|nr:uncharacterized protein ppp1r18 [Thalassophryne amazonica]